MSENDMKRPSLTDWERLECMEDDEIDFSDIPPLTEAFFERARVVMPPEIAERIIAIDSDILLWFKSQGKDYHKEINQILRSFVESQHAA